MLRFRSLLMRLLAAVFAVTASALMAAPAALAHGGEWPDFVDEVGGVITAVLLVVCVCILVTRWWKGRAARDGTTGGNTPHRDAPGAAGGRTVYALRPRAAWLRWIGLGVAALWLIGLPQAGEHYVHHVMDGKALHCAVASALHPVTGTAPACDLPAPALNDVRAVAQEIAAPDLSAQRARPSARAPPEFSSIS